MSDRAQNVVLFKFPKELTAEPKVACIDYPLMDDNVFV